jgi:ribosomal protein S12
MEEVYLVRLQMEEIRRFLRTRQPAVDAVVQSEPLSMAPTVGVVVVGVMGLDLRGPALLLMAATVVYLIQNQTRVVGAAETAGMADARIRELTGVGLVETELTFHMQAPRI